MQPERLGVQVLLALGALAVVVAAAHFALAVRDPGGDKVSCQPDEAGQTPTWCRALRGLRTEVVAGLAWLAGAAVAWCLAGVAVLYGRYKQHAPGAAAKRA